MSRRRVVWSEVQPELLTLIAERLGTRFDTFNFRLVCKSWREATSFGVRGPKSFLSSLCPFRFTVSDCNWEIKGVESKSPLVLVATSVLLVGTLLNPIAIPWLCTVEELIPGRLELRHPLPYYIFSRNSPSVVPDNLNLSLFKVKEVLRLYTIKVSDNITGKLKTYGDGVSVKKTLLVADPNCKTDAKIHDCNVVALINKGSLQLYSIKNFRVDRMTGLGIKLFDDIVNFKGSIFAIDRKGRGYTMSYNSPRMNLIVSQQVGEGSGTDRKKRLVVSCTGEVYLLHRCPVYMKGTFRLYKLNEEKNSWDEVEGIGADRMLIVTSDGCFFVETNDFPRWRGNCIVFTKGLFPCYTGASRYDTDIFGAGRSSRDVDLAVFHFDTGECKTNYSSLFWPPPGWLASDTGLFKSTSVAEIEIMRDFYYGLASESSREMEASEAILAMKDKIKTKQGPVVIDIDTLPDITPEACGNAAAQDTFQGVNVCSNLVPVLQKIWERYGNVIEEHVVSSNSLLTWILESLAKMVIIIQTNSNETLEDSQAEFLKATMKDLQHLQIRLDWLVPFLDTVFEPEMTDP
ncbi:hypothetical protein vseg_013951 [Gypsophila vaccaria]